ncbi:hypothetical protein FGIG_10229 [Fasciola gigantica]|uniref:Uncharacterized protein n=1 Tax=Fasciola gigantica TaxID=46835 RepID=A0A504YGM0_FASGI|nr:hypothetical protein FGIG_10229 [Fasciola gigantica]
MANYPPYYIINPSYPSLSSFAQYYDYDLLGRPISTFRQFIQNPLALIRAFMTKYELALRLTVLYLFCIIYLVQWSLENLPSIWHRMKILNQLMKETLKSQKMKLPKEENGYQAADNFAAAAYRAHTGLQGIFEDEFRNPIPGSLLDYEMIRFVSESNWIRRRTNQRLAYADKLISREYKLVYPAGEKFSREMRSLVDHNMEDEVPPKLPTTAPSRSSVWVRRQQLARRPKKKFRSMHKDSLIRSGMFKLIDHRYLEELKSRDITDPYDNLRWRHRSYELVNSQVKQLPESTGVEKRPLSSEKAKRLTQMSGWIEEYRRRQKEAAEEQRKASQFMRCHLQRKKRKAPETESKESVTADMKNVPDQEVEDNSKDSLRSFRATSHYFSFQDSPSQELDLRDVDNVLLPRRKISLKRHTLGPPGKQKKNEYEGSETKCELPARLFEQLPDVEQNRESRGGSYKPGRPRL